MIDSKFIQDTTLGVSVFYKELFYNEITQSQTITIEVMFSFIGGNMGLFIGMSLLSVVELIELFFNLIVITVTSNNIDDKKKNDFNNEDTTANSSSTTFNNNEKKLFEKARSSPLKLY
jgi:uncharacterized membrane protein